MNVAMLFLGMLALIFSIILSLLGRKFDKHEEGELYEKIVKLLPNMNCGSCGQANCSEFAKAVIRDNSLFQNCRPGGKEVSDRLAVIFGLKPEGKEKKKFARILCARTDNLEKNFNYQGIDSCKGMLLLGYPFKCHSACLNKGDCIDVCQFKAITPGEFTPQINIKACTGCGACVDICPVKIIELYSEDEVTYAKCACSDPLPDKAKNCDDGCVSCRICEKHCPKDAVKVIGNRVVYDYEKCINCQICKDKCPRNVIRKSAT